jgi:hypothetical protein
MARTKGQSEKLDGDGDEALNIRVLQRLNAIRQRQSKKKEERPLNRFTTVKTQPTRPA